MSPDFVNGLFEAIGGLFIWMNVVRIYRDKAVRGVYVPSTVFFTSWGIWNLYYYPSFDQWWSFSGGLVIVVANSIWISLALYYGGTYGTVNRYLKSFSS